MTVKKIYEIEFSSATIKRRFERFLALLHYNSNFGHSGLFGMYLDGDGSEKIQVKNHNNRYMREVDLIGGIGYDIEIVNDNGYSGRFIDSQRECRWVVLRSATMYKNGEIYKTLPKGLND